MSLASENLKRIGAADALGRFKEKAFQEWELRCRADLAPAREQSSLALRDELPKFFDQLIGALRTEDSEIKSDLSSMTALEHGKERADFSHYTLDQVIHEYQLLRTVLTEFLEADGYLNSDIRKTLLDFIDLTGNSLKRPEVLQKSKSLARVVRFLSLSRVKARSKIQQRFQVLCGVAKWEPSCGVRIGQRRRSVRWSSGHKVCSRQ